MENVLQNFHNHAILPTIKKAKNIANAIAVSSVEAGKGFSVMIIIYSEKRSRHAVSNVSNHMTIISTGLPLEF